MTSIKAYINGHEFGVAAKRFETFTSGPVCNWELYLDNSSGASQILDAGMYVADFGVDQHTLLKGYVDDVLPRVVNPSAVFDKMVLVKGRNIARDLARLTTTASFKNARLGDIFNVALMATGSELSSDYGSTGQGPILSGDVDAVDTYLLNLFNDCTKRAGYGYTVHYDDKRLYAWPLNTTPHTNVLLKALANDPTSNILLIDRENDGFSICNCIKVKSDGMYDILTEETASQLIGVNVSFANDYVARIYGQSSVRVTFSATGDMPEVHFKFPILEYKELDYSNIPQDACSIRLLHDLRNQIGTLEYGSVNLTVYMYIKDSNGTILNRLLSGNTWTNQWTKKEFILGTEAPLAGVGVEDGWVNQSGGAPFNWVIVEMWFRFIRNGAGSVWLDGLVLPAMTAFATVQDSVSIAKVGKSMLPLYRPNLKTQAALKAEAETELALRKDPFTFLTLTCTFQPDLLYAGLLVDVLAPETYIGYQNTPDVYRIRSIKHVCEPGVDLCRGHDAITVLELISHEGGKQVGDSRVNLASDNQFAINSSHEGRLKVLEDSRSGAGSGGGGSGSSIFDGGTLTNPLEIKNLFPFINEAQDQMYNWLWGYYRPDPLAYLRFANVDVNKAHYIDLYGVMVSNGVDEGPGLGLTGHFVCAKDIVCRGMLSSYEGVVALQGNKNAGWAPTINPMIWLSKGGIYGNCNTLEIRKIDGTTGSGFVWGWGGLEAGSITLHGSVNTSHLRSMDGLGFIALYNNLEPYGNHIVDLGSLYRAYRALYVRDVQAGYVTAQAVFTDSIGSASNTNFYITPWAGRSINLVANTTVDGDLTVNGRITGSGANPFNQDLNTYNAVRFNDITNTGSLTVSGNITCHGALDVTHLRADGPYSIALYSSLIPYVNHSLDLGSYGSAFRDLYVRDVRAGYVTAQTAYVSSLGSAGGNTIYPASGGIRLGSASNMFAEVHSKLFNFSGCERSLSGQEWIQKIQSQETALEVLTHEVTKTVYHTTYNLDAEDEVICVCGKSVKEPCLEHQEEYKEKYSKSINTLLEASAFLALEHQATLTKHQMTIETLQEKIAALEEKLAKQTEVIRND